MIPFIGARAMDSIFLLSKASTFHLRGAFASAQRFVQMKTVWRRGRRKKEGGKERQKSILKYLNPVFKSRQRILFLLFAPQKLPTEGSRFSGLEDQNHPDSTLALTAISRLHRRVVWLLTIKADRLQVADIPKLGTAILFSYSHIYLLYFLSSLLSSLSIILPLGLNP